MLPRFCRSARSLSSPTHDLELAVAADLEIACLGFQVEADHARDWVRGEMMGTHRPS